MFHLVISQGENDNVVDEKMGTTTLILENKTHFSFIPGVPRKEFTSLFENDKKTISLTSLVLPFFDLLIL